MSINAHNGAITMDNERQNNILEILKTNKSIKVRDLAEKLYVSEATIRRDLAEMQKTGVLRRNHGGAVAAESADEISIFVRMNVNAKQKELVATKALEHIPDFKTVFIDSSSTALALALRLDLANKTVVTNNLQTALSLSRIRDVNLIIPGGSIAIPGVSVTGSWTVKQLQSFSFDLMLASCASIKNCAAYEKSLEQREIKLVAFDNSATRILLADSAKTKIKDGTYLFNKLSAFDKIIFDRLDSAEKEQFAGLPIVC